MEAVERWPESWTECSRYSRSTDRLSANTPMRPRLLDETASTEFCSLSRKHDTGFIISEMFKVFSLLSFLVLTKPFNFNTIS